MKDSLRVLLMALLFPLVACAFSGNAIEGHVLEAGTKKPLPGAIVIARWEKTYVSIGHSSSACVHVESAVTDEQGRFRLPTWRGKTPHDLDTHKPGYERSPERDGTAGEYDVVLQPFTGTKEERLKYLQRVNSATGCGSAGESKKNLLPLAKALYEEALGLAKTEDEKKIVNNLLFSLEIIELGYEVAERRDIERRRGRK